jgi:hypothetical protein
LFLLERVDFVGIISFGVGGVGYSLTTREKIGINKLYILYMSNAAGTYTTYTNQCNTSGSKPLEGNQPTPERSVMRDERLYR